MQKAIQTKVVTMTQWYQTNKKFYNLDPTTISKLSILFFETRFMRYFGRVIPWTLAHCVTMIIRVSLTK